MSEPVSIDERDILLEDACRGIDVAGPMARTRRRLAELCIPCIGAETVGSAAPRGIAETPQRRVGR